MELYLKIIRVYFKIMSKLNPGLAAKQAFTLFQIPRKIPFKNREQKFYNTSGTFTAPSELGDIICYENGDPAGEVVFLVHGWGSNAGSMAGIGNALSKEGFYVISFDLPAHGKSKEKYANLLNCRMAMQAVLRRVQTSRPISIIAHSFGSAVSAFALCETNYVVKNLMYLTCPNQLKTIFRDYKKMIGLGDKSYQLVIRHAEKLLAETIEDITVAEKTGLINYEKLTLIHDEHDKILPFSNSVAIAQMLPDTELVAFEYVGHYRMLWNQEVIDRVIFEMKESRQSDLSLFKEKLKEPLLLITD